MSNYPTLSGVGGLKYSARWHTVGRPVVYLAESPAGAMLEVLVHLDADGEELPDRFTLLQVESPDSLSVEVLPVPRGAGWRQNLETTRLLGDTWLAGMQNALGKVPSALVPQTWNYLLNPLHPDASKVRIAAKFEDRYDLRLLGLKQRDPPR
jgi:RES domain-containing protein